MFGLIFVLAFTPKKIQSIPMISNYFKIALRSLWKNRTYSFINITGLAIGIAASVLILLYVSHEYSYDQFHANAQQIYRVSTKVKYGNNEVNIHALPATFGPKLKENSSNVINYVRTRMADKVVIESDASHRFFEQRFLFADTSLLRVFSFKLLRGDGSLFSKPNTVAITEAIAKKYFGDSDPIGKVITYDKKYLFEVVALIAKAPSNSSIQFDFVTPFNSLLSVPEQKQILDEDVGAYITYLQVITPEALPAIERSIVKMSKLEAGEKIMLTPFTETHLGNQFGDATNTQSVKVFLLVAMLILILALVNYINLTTARGLLRAKEVGIRKTIGARRGALTIQFYFESALMTSIAFVLALVLIEVTIPLFLNTLQQDIDRNFLISPLFMSLTGLLLIVCILVSGGYPALILSKFKPAEVLKGKLSGNGQNSWLRKGFIVFQFATSIALIICSLVVQHQLEHMRSSSLGLDKNQVVVLNIDGDLTKNYSTLKEDIRQLTGVQSVGASSTSLYSTNGTNAYFTTTPTTHEEVFINVLSIDEQFLSTMNIQWIRKEKDSIAAGDLVINEAALDKLKMTPDDLGKSLALGSTKSIMQGMVNDFNYTSLKENINGLVMSIEHDTASSLVNYGGALYIKLNEKANSRQSIEAIKKIYEHYQSNTPFQFHFLDDAFDQLYKGEERLFKIFEAFTGIAVFIACLGLFGLITFSSERRSKEIGIRKILGASVKSIVTLLSLEFIVLISISLAIAAPVAWMAMNKWLQGFSYRIEIPLLFVAIAGVAAVLISLITISFQAIKAAIANPVDSLKNE